MSGPENNALTVQDKPRREIRLPLSEVNQFYAAFTRFPTKDELDLAAKYLAIFFDSMKSDQIGHRD